MNKLVSILIFSLWLTGCLLNNSTFDQGINLEKFGAPIKLEYYKSIPHKAFKYCDTVAFVITDKEELSKAINEIKDADNPEPWKGAGWNRIKIFYTDTILNINTNNTKIGLSASGTFYSLNKNNFITKRL